MAVDIRGRIACNLGVLISASLNDSYLPGAGIIKTTGTAIVKDRGFGLLDAGVDVEFIVTPPGAASGYKIPRYVKPVSYRYNPVERTTRIELACNWALRETWAENIIWTPEDDPQNVNYTQGDFEIVTAPIYGKSVLGFCLNKLDLTGIEPELVPFKFSRPEFDFSPGYVQIISDLLLSLGLVGVGLSANRVVAVSPFVGSAGAITESKLINLEPIGTGVPPSGVIVTYDTLKLKEPDPEQVAKTNWEVEEVFGTPTTVRISFKNGDETWSSTFNYVPYQKIWRQYDTWDRLVRSVTVNRTIGAAVAASYCQALVQDDANKNVGLGPRAVSYGKEGFDSTSTVDIKYVIDAPVDVLISGSKIPTVGYEEVLSETQSTYRASAEVLCSVAPGFFDEDDNLINIGPGVSYESLDGDLPPTPLVGILTEQTITTYEQAKRNVTVITETVKDEEGNESYRYGRLGYFPVTKTITKSVKCYGFTSRGQQDIATRVDQGETLENFAGDVLRLADDGTEVRIVSGREAVLQARPSAADRILAQNADTSGNAADNGYSTVEESEALFVTDGSAGGLFPLRLRVPYVSDDTFTRSGTAPNFTYSSVPANPPPENTARNFGETQSALVIGSQLGVSVQCVADALGDSPVGRVSVILGGSSGVYFKNGITYTLSNEGAIASADLIAIGNGGGDGAWLPKPGGIALPNLPTITSTAPTTLLGTIGTVGSEPQVALNAAFPDAETGDGALALDTYFYWLYTGSAWTNVGLTPGDVVIDPDIVPMFEEIVLLRGTTRSRVEVTRIAYALYLLTVLPPISIKVNVTATRIRKVVVPAAAPVTLAAQLPAVSIGAKVAPPATGVTLAALAPVVSAGSSVSVPSSDFSVTGLVPEVLGTPSTDVLVPAADIAVAASTPAVSAGASVSVPAIDTAVAAQIPAVTIVTTDPNFSSVSLLLHLDGADGGTTFTDSSSNAFTVTRGGNAELDTAVAKFGTAAVIWDGTGDFLRTPSDADFTFGTGDFTIEFWSYFNSSFNTGAAAILMSIGEFRNITYTASTLRYRTDGGANLITGGALSLSTWYHIALTKSGNDHRLFIDGTQTGSTYTSSTSYADTRITFGAGNTGGNTYLGSMDEIRVTKGVARYTANFTAPTQAFPDA